jgi:hypothetical protein
MELLVLALLFSPLYIDFYDDGDPTKEKTTANYSFGVLGSSYATGSGVSFRLYDEDSFWQFTGFGEFYEEDGESDFFNLGVTYNRYFYESPSGQASMRYMVGGQYYFESWEEYNHYGRTYYDEFGREVYDGYEENIIHHENLWSLGAGLGIDFFGSKRESGFIFSIDTFLYGEYYAEKKRLDSAGITASVGLLYNF